MTKETVHARAFTLARQRAVIFGRPIGKADQEVFTLVECPICWALTMPDKAVAHAERDHG